MRLYEQIVPLDRIDIQDTTYRITTRSGIEDLTASIDRLGVLQPPILQPTGSRWSVVAGFRRIAACRRICRGDVPARLLSSGAGEQQRIELAIADNSLQRPLNLIETARSVQLLVRCHKDHRQLAAAAADLNLPDSPAMLEKLLRLAALPASIQNAVLDDVTALATALALGDLEAPLAEKWVRIFRQLNLGLNRQRELMTLVAEIAVREDRGESDVLADNEVRRILSAPDVDAARKYRMLAATLRRRRFPHIFRAERRFEELVRDLALGPRVRLIAPAHFEATTYQLHLLFAGPEELQQHLQTVEELLEHPAFKSLLG